MGVCRRQALRILGAQQRLHPDIEILWRPTAKAKWQVNPHGLAKARELERDRRHDTMDERVGFLESDSTTQRYRIDRLQIRIQNLEKAQKLP